MLDNQVPAANDDFISQQQIDIDSDNYITEDEEQEANGEDSIDSPLFSPVSCASEDPLEQQIQQTISEQHVEENGSSNAQNEDNNQLQWNGFTIVIDNLDKNIRRSFQRIDFQTRSLHICNAYACC